MRKEVFAICIDNKGFENDLTVNKEYKLIAEYTNSNEYILYNDHNDTGKYPQRLFK